MASPEPILTERLPRGSYSSLYLSSFSPRLGAVIACQASNSLFRLDFEQKRLQPWQLNLDLPGELVSIYVWDSRDASYLAGASCSGSADDEAVSSCVFVVRFQIREGTILPGEYIFRHVDYVPFLISTLPDVLQNEDDPTLFVSGSNNRVYLLSSSTLDPVNGAPFPDSILNELSTTIMSIDFISTNGRIIVATSSNDGNIFLFEGIPDDSQFKWKLIGSLLLDGPLPVVQLSNVADVISLVVIAAVGGAYSFRNAHVGLDANPKTLNLLPESNTSDCLISLSYDPDGNNFLLIGSWVQEILVYECDQDASCPSEKYVGRLQVPDPVYNMAWCSMQGGHVLFVFTMREVLAFSRSSILLFIESCKKIQSQ